MNAGSWRGLPCCMCTSAASLNRRGVLSARLTRGKGLQGLLQGVHGTALGKQEGESTSIA